MSPVLDALIERFRVAQDQAVAVLVTRLGIPIPETNDAWPSVRSEFPFLRTTNERDGVKFRVHGYGIELKFDGTTIDFDWGPNGEPDGFDAWRLSRFRGQNCRKIRCSLEQIETWTAEAYASGELIKIGSLYFDPNRRVKAYDSGSVRRAQRKSLGSQPEGAPIKERVQKERGER